MQLNVCDGKIQFLNVNFCYKLELPILKNINLEIKSGQTVGIVGPTGNNSFLGSILNSKYIRNVLCT